MLKELEIIIMNIMLQDECCRSLPQLLYTDECDVLFFFFVFFFLKEKINLSQKKF